MDGAYGFQMLDSGQCGAQHGARFNRVHCVIPDSGRMGVRHKGETISMWHDCAAWVKSKLVLANFREKGRSAGAIVLQGILLPSTLVLD